MGPWMDASGLEAEPLGEAVQVAAVELQCAGGGGPVAVMGGQGLLDQRELEGVGGGPQAEAAGQGGNRRHGGAGGGGQGPAARLK